MKTTTYLLTVSALAATLTFTGCTQNQENLAVAGVAVAGAAAIAASHSDGSHTDNYYHHGHDYGQNRNYGYQDGVRAGCDSRQNRWRKDYDRYKHDYNYKDGWDAGYRRCR